MQSLSNTFWGISLCVALCVTSNVFSQNLKLTGIVSDEFGHPLVGATIEIVGSQKGAVTDRKGFFDLENLAKGKYKLEYKFLGYNTDSDSIVLEKSMSIRKKLCPSNKQLGEITVTEAVLQRKMSNSLSVEIVDKAYLQQQSVGSLMQTLSRLPGVSAMEIGAGQSKPVIRGLGFNRVVVAENGVKHEAQEWGVDHGLEIDQFGIERIEILKGPAGLMYGASAIAGVIDLKQLMAPAKNSFGGNVLLRGQSNNDLLGTSAKWFQRFDKFYYKMHFSYTDYSDYKVPIDSIEYMTYFFKLKNNRMRNTAGRERNGGFTLGYLNNFFSTHLSVNNHFSNSGFFANAHGLEIRNSQINYDQSARDIDLPSQQANHFKVLSNSILMISDYKLNLDLGFQNNYRQEFSEAVAHGYMPIPADSLERLYRKNTLTANFKMELPQHDRNQFSLGFNTEYQHNTSGGWGFMLPNFRSALVGAYVYDFIRLSESWTTNAGLRYDLGRLQTDIYTDWYATPNTDGTSTFVQRSHNLEKVYGSWSWGLGAIHKAKNTTIKINVGKSFRMPTAKELASNGINYHMYRYEKGDTALQAEKSYQLDVGFTYQNGKWDLSLNPFVNYFPNYIYLNPTAEYYEAQQIFYHSQSQVFRTGGEWVATYNIAQNLKLSADMEYVHSVQLSGNKKGYTLPFSPPLTSNVELRYEPKSKGWFEKPSIAVLIHLVGTQNNIVPPEKKTPGHTLLNFSAGTNLKVGHKTLHVNALLNNALNTKYYDHTSFYRLIEVPGQGRNFILNIEFAF